MAEGYAGGFLSAVLHLGQKPPVSSADSPLFKGAFSLCGGRVRHRTRPGESAARRARPPGAPPGGIGGGAPYTKIGWRVGIDIFA